MLRTVWHTTPRPEAIMKDMEGKLDVSGSDMQDDVCEAVT